MKATKRIILILSVLALLIGCFAFTSSAADDTVTLDFSSITKKGTIISNVTAAKTLLQNVATDSSVISSVSTCTNVYEGNGSGGAFSNQGGFLKMGKSGGNGKLEVVFTKKITQVEVTCHTWTTSSSDTIFVNGTSQVAPKTGSFGTLTFTLSTPSSTLTLESTTRAFVKKIVITFEPSFVCDCSETTFVSNGNSTHNEVCTETQCGKVVKSNIACDIAYTDNENGTHTAACQDGCGYSKTVNCTEGAYAPTGDGETHSVKCGVCNAVLDTNVPCSDKGSGECEDCGGKITVKHVFSYTDNGDRTHSVSCSHCDKTFDDEPCVDEDKDTYCDYCEAFVAYVASFVTPDGITAPANVEGYDVTLPTLDGFLGIKFAGWATEKVSKTETKPTLYSGEVTLTADVTYYAVFSYTYDTTKTEQTKDTWQLVTDVTTLEAGDRIIIVASGVDYALSTNQKTSNRDVIKIEKPTDNTVTINDSVQILTLEAGTKANTFAFYTGSGYLYAASSGSNQLKTQATNNDNGSWKIEISTKGVATITAQGSYTRNLLRYNPNNGSPLFSCYASGQEDISIYKFVPGEEQEVEVKVTNYSSTIATFSGANVNLGANLSVKYAVDTVYNLEDLTVIFSFNEEELEPVSVEEGRFILKNIAPNQMDFTIDAKLMLGEKVIATYNDYSVLANLENILKIADEKTKALVEATLAYGDAAFAYKNGDALTEDDRLEWVDNGNDVLEFVGEDAYTYFKSFNVLFAEVNKIRVKYNALPEGYKVYLEGTEIVGENGVIETDGILANELGSTYVFVIEDADGNTVATLKCNVYAYCAMAKDSANVAMANLATVLNNYGNLAANYSFDKEKRKMNNTNKEYQLLEIEVVEIPSDVITSSVTGGFYGEEMDFNGKVNGKA